MNSRVRRRLAGVGVITMTLLGGMLVVGTTTASGDPVNETRGIRKAVTLAGVREHQQAFQAISDANGGNRVASSPGYEASADYVEQRLEAAGYTVTRDPFQFVFNADLTPPVFEQVSPNPATYSSSPPREPTTATPAAARPPTSPASRPGRSPWSSGAPARSPRRPGTRRRRAPWP